MCPKVSVCQAYSPKLALLRRGAVWGAMAAILLVASAPADAFAAGRSSAQRAHGSGGRRAPLSEKKFGAKKETSLDAAVQQTKDLSPSKAATTGPSSFADSLRRGDIEALMESKLDEEIKLSADLLQFETTCEETAPVRYRLADLYWEKAKRAFFRANDSFATQALRTELMAEQKALQGKSLALYQQILDTCTNFADVPKVLFYYGKSLMELERSSDATVQFRRIIKEFPDTQWVPQAWFMVGEHYFNTVNDANAALKAYIKAAQTPRTPIYGFALYKQAWCYINVAEWGLAQKRLEEAVHVAADVSQPLDDRVRGALRKEALKDYVRVFANSGEPAQAHRKFASLAGEQDVAGMLESLGNWYVGQGAHQNVVAVYRDLIKSYPQSWRRAVYQGRIVDAVGRLGSPKDTVREVKLLAEEAMALRLRSQSAPPSVDRAKITKDVAEAEELSENTLRRLAVDYHKQAKKLRGLPQNRQYQYALDLYRYYLEVFPEPKAGSDFNYVFFMRYYYAEVLYKLEQFLPAAQNYEAVVALDPKPTEAKHKEVVLAAAEEAVRAYDEVAVDLDRKNPPEVSGTQEKPIPDLKLHLIAACRRYIDTVGKQGDKIVEIRYKMARIYYTYNHFAEAAPAFNDIVENHPESSVACYAANLVLDVYNGKKDYTGLRDASRAYIASKRLACGDDDRRRFMKIEEQSTFYLIKQQLEDSQKYVAAGNAYMLFYRDHSKSELADDAVYNAAVNYDLGNRLGKANEVRRFLVEKLPDSKLVPETLYNMAQSYERIVDFEAAAQAFELFAKRYPSDKRSKDAIFNAASYRATLRDFAGAQATRQNFIRLYPNDADVHKLVFANCEALELQAQLTANPMPVYLAARDCYMNYLKKFHGTDPDLICHAQARRAVIMGKVHNEKGAEQTRAYLIKMWPTFKKVGVARLPHCAEDVAEARFLELEAPRKAYTEAVISALDPTPRGKKNFDASRTRKIAERDALVAQYRSVAQLGVAQWSLAALYQIGAAYVESIEKFLAAPIPDKIPNYKLTAEDKSMLRQQLRELAAPIEEQAVEAFKLCVTTANTLGRYNKWSVHALDALQKLRPNAYPLVGEEMATLSQEAPLRLQQNGLVVQEGDGYRPIHLNLKGLGKKPLPAADSAAAVQSVPPTPPSPPPPAATKHSPAHAEDMPDLEADDITGQQEPYRAPQSEPETTEPAGAAQTPAAFPNDLQAPAADTPGDSSGGTP
jgi:TolA-binding protein